MYLENEQHTGAIVAVVFIYGMYKCGVLVYQSVVCGVVLYTDHTLEHFYTIHYR